MEFKKEIEVWNIWQLEKYLDKIFNKKVINKTSMLDMLVDKWITRHVWGMSDPFQPCEETFWITKAMIDIGNKYWISMLFSTKWCSVYWADIRPELHTFQFSFTNLLQNNNIEPWVPNIDKRIQFYKELKQRWFKVWIRIQPFIPWVTNTDIIDTFSDADNFTIEWLKLVPQNIEHVKMILEKFWLDKKDFTQKWLLTLLPEIRKEMYKPFIEKLEQYWIPYSIADNDMRTISKNDCCCGDSLIKKSTNFNPTYLIKNYWKEFWAEQLKQELGELWECVINNLFTSNRQYWCKTANEFIDRKICGKWCPFSPNYQK